MNFTMMTMATQTSRAKRLIKMLERLLKQDHLYSDVDAYRNSKAFDTPITDYDELYDDDDGYPD